MSSVSTIPPNHRSLKCSSEWRIPQVKKKEISDGSSHGLFVDSHASASALPESTSFLQALPPPPPDSTSSLPAPSHATVAAADEPSPPHIANAYLGAHTPPRPAFPYRLPPKIAPSA
ncbi:hypothetical protein R3P38DRAFT_3172121 [Favolaschia claudopus]|uniref:Uncharacterized protein n=1 Tax=Favolaschia claudopus TaxID=2862362 RepID=A0AAW0DIQ5_9AGAR